jgi:hypothetical protein
MVEAVPIDSGSPLEGSLCMAKAALIVFADIETHADLGRVVNAMVTAREFREAGDEARLIFDGAGTRWIGELAKPDHRSHRLYESVRGQIAGAYAYCAAAFHAKEQIEAAGIPLLDEFKQHPSVHRLVAAGYEVITF